VEDRVRDEQPSPDEVAAVRDAVLAWHEELARPALEPADSRASRWLALPRMLAGLVRMLAVRRPPAFLVADQEAARLYQRLRGIDPQLARAEVWRMGEQLGSLDERLLVLEADRPGRLPGADRAELQVAAGALAEWYLQGRRTDDELAHDTSPTAGCRMLAHCGNRADSGSCSSLSSVNSTAGSQSLLAAAQYQGSAGPGAEACGACWSHQRRHATR
jgi:hypothetical protein